MRYVRRASQFLRARRVPLLSGTLRLVLVLLVAVCVVEILAPGTYRLAQGFVTFQIEPAWPGGQVIMPLGPAGVLELHTHRTPVNLKIDFTLYDSVPTLPEATALLEGLPHIRADAAAAFNSFLESKIVWLLLSGALAGVLVSGGLEVRRWRRILLRALLGVAVVCVATAALVGVTLLTYDHSPAVRYQGLARNLPRVIEMARALTAESPAATTGIHDLVRGIETVAEQLSIAAQVRPRHDVTRVLFASDVHDNIVGMKLASALVRDPAEPFSFVMLGGDLTNRGTALEAQLFTSQFSSHGLPVLMIGGNHEDMPAMRVFARAGYRILNATSATIAGVTVYGLTDPMAYSFNSTPDMARVNAAGLAALERWKRLDPAPQVLLVHELAEAQPIIDWAKRHHEVLTVAYGHDHVVGLRADGSVTLVDAGTAGASGYIDLAHDPNRPYTFQILDFSRGPDPHLVAVTTMAYTGLSGSSTAIFTPISP